MGKVIVPLDGSDLGVRAVQLGALLSLPLCAELTLVHVLGQPATQLNGVEKPDLSHFVEIACLQAGRLVPAETVYLHGEPVDELLKLANGHPESLMVIGTRARAGLARLVFGSVADSVVRGARVPVVVTRDSMYTPRPTISTLLVPLDGSELAEQALPLALRLARRTGATVALVRVVEQPRAVPYVGLAGGAELADELTQEARDAARSYLDEQVRRLRLQGVRASWEVRLGRPSDEIIRAAETMAADLIVMSTHGRGGLRRLAFGSVTDEVLHHGATPVMVVPSTLEIADSVQVPARSATAPVSVS